MHEEASGWSHTVPPRQPRSVREQPWPSEHWLEERGRDGAHETPAPKSCSVPQALMQSLIDCYLIHNVEQRKRELIFAKHTLAQCLSNSTLHVVVGEHVRWTQPQCGQVDLGFCGGQQAPSQPMPRPRSTLSSASLEHSGRTLEGAE